MNKKILSKNQIDKIKLLLNQLSEINNIYVWSDKDGWVDKVTPWYSLDDLSEKMNYSDSYVKLLIQMARENWEQLNMPDKFIVSFKGKYLLTNNKAKLKRYCKSIRTATHKKTKIFNNLLDVMEVEDEN